MKNIVIKIFIISTFVASVSGCSFSEFREDMANRYGREIYYELDEYIFDPAETRKAVSKLKLISYVDEDAEWVKLSLSLLMLNSGYQVGDFYLKDSYVDSMLTLSYAVAFKVLKNSEHSQSYAHIARLQTINGDYKKAWLTLNKAYKLDKTNFYSWFLRGVIVYMMGDYRKAEELLVESGKLTEFKYQRRLVIRYRQKAARMARDYIKEEQLLLQNIRENPDYAYMYSHYAGFLKRHKRYDEAIEYYEKAIKIKPYPNAIRLLKNLKEEVSGR